MQTWLRFRRLSARERRIVLTAAAALVLLRISLRLLGFRLCKGALQLMFPARLSEPKADADVSPIARLEAAASRHLFFRPNCLERSLVLWWLLGRRRIPAELRIGVKKERNSFEAHAWVESGGVVWNDPDAEHRHFVPLSGAFASLEAESR
jgi:hypothetical protein